MARLYISSYPSASYPEVNAIGQRVVHSNVVLASARLPVFGVPCCDLRKTLKEDMDVLIADAKRFIHDQAHFTARFLKEMKDQSNIDEETIAAGICGAIALYLTAGNQAQLLANFLLVSFPLLFTYVFVNECPNVELLQLHWACFGVLTLLDRSMEEALPSYYLFKVLFFVLLYLKPVMLCDKMLIALQDFKEQASRAFGAGVAGHQPLATSTSLSSSTGSTSSSSGTSTFQKRNSKLKAMSPVRTEETQLSHSRLSLNGSSDMTKSPAFKIEDAMFNDPRHALTPQTMDYEMNPSQPALPISFNDLIFLPQSKLVFNGPFDEHTLTYYMSMQSNTNKPIAFAIKSNAIPRVTAIPPYGILKPKEKQLIAVFVQKFDYEAEKEKASRDRIAFDYVFCGPEVPKFSHKLFQGSEMRRRKSIQIEYNP